MRLYRQRSSPIDKESMNLPEEAQTHTVQRSDAIIWTEDLTRTFAEEVAVADVTMAVPRGSIFGFIGPSGSGKTTTIRLLTGMYVPTSGEMRVLGVDPALFDQSTRAQIGYMPQLFVLYPELTVWENLNFVASLYGMPLRRQKRLHEVLDFVELDEHRHKLVREISGGMQRRLSLAATLIHHPELIFLDEPTAGIDPVLRRKFWEHFQELQQEGRTLFITTQYVSEAAYCDLVGVLSEGRLLVVDTPTALRYRAFGGDIVDFEAEHPLSYTDMHALRELPFVQGLPRRVGEEHVRLVVSEAATDIPELLEWAKAQDLSVVSVEEYMPPFDDVFVELVEEDNGE